MRLRYFLVWEMRSARTSPAAPTTAGSAWDEDRYYGIRDYVNGGYDGLIRWRLRDGGLTLYYLSMQGWVEENALIHDLHDAGTRPITAGEAAETARDALPSGP